MQDYGSRSGDISQVMPAVGGHYLSVISILKPYHVVPAWLSTYMD